MGLGQGEERTEALYSALAPCLNLGIFGVGGTGMLIAMANAKPFYESSAVLTTVIALAAGGLFTYGAARTPPVKEGPPRWGVAWAAALGGSVWALGSLIVLTVGLIPPGLFNRVTAAGLILLRLAEGPLRAAFLAGVALVLAATVLATQGLIAPGVPRRADAANQALRSVMAPSMLVALRVRSPPAGPLVLKLARFPVIPIPVSAAAGLWIGLP